MDNKEFFRSIHYLGSKSRLVHPIGDLVLDHKQGAGPVLDMFAGSGVMSAYLARFSDTISTDIQTYSDVICNAHLTAIDGAPDSTGIVDRIRCGPKTKTLLDAFCLLIQYENDALAAARRGDIGDLYEIVDCGSLYRRAQEEHPDRMSKRLDRCLGMCLRKLSAVQNLKAADSMLTKYYGGLYFSYKQAVDMDCISTWIFQQGGALHTKALAALLGTASEIVNTIGQQFAQPLKVRDGRGQLKQSLARKIINDRSKNVYTVFADWLDYYLSLDIPQHSWFFLKNDYADALKALADTHVSAIYADPPYTRYHYSRYYHVLESICLRDCPDVSTRFSGGKGGPSRAIYRTDRHQSPFCIKSQVEAAFDKLFRRTRAFNVPLIMSYSPYEKGSGSAPRLRTINELMTQARQYYGHVDIGSLGAFAHAKLNSVEHHLAAPAEAECILVCRP